MSLGQRELLRKLERKGWSQQELARRMGIEPAVVSRWITGARVPNLENALALQNLLAIKPKLWLCAEPEAS